jgi:hypothetical protein
MTNSVVVSFNQVKALRKAVDLFEGQYPGRNLGFEIRKEAESNELEFRVIDLDQ